MEWVFSIFVVAIVGSLIIQRAAFCDEHTNDPRSKDANA